MSATKLKIDTLTQRLCSEIQLFDLCDLTLCKSRNGRFCTDPLLLDRFEKIAENELRVTERFISEKSDDADTDDSEEGDEFALDDYEGVDEDNREEEE